MEEEPEEYLKHLGKPDVREKQEKVIDENEFDLIDQPEHIRNFFKFKKVVGPSISVKLVEHKKIEVASCSYTIQALIINNYDQYNKFAKYNNVVQANEEFENQDFGQENDIGGSFVQSTTLLRNEGKGNEKKKKNPNQFFVIVKIVLVINIILFLLQLGQIIIVYLKSMKNTDYFDSMRMISHNILYFSQSFLLNSSLSYYTSIFDKENWLAANKQISETDFLYLMQLELNEVIKQTDNSYNNMKVNATNYSDVLKEFSESKQILKINEKWQITEESMRNEVLFEEMLTNMIKTSDYIFDEFDLKNYFLFSQLPSNKTNDVPLNIINLFSIYNNFYPSFVFDSVQFAKKYFVRLQNDISNYDKIINYYFYILMGIKSIYVIGLIFAIIYIGRKLRENVDKVQQIYIDRVSKNLDFTQNIRDLFIENFNRIKYKNLINKFEMSNKKTETAAANNNKINNNYAISRRIKDNNGVNQKNKLVRYVDLSLNKPDSLPSNALVDINFKKEKIELVQEEIDANVTKFLKVDNNMKISTFIFRTVTLIFSAYIVYYVLIMLLNNMLFEDLDKIHQLDYHFFLRTVSVLNMANKYKTNLLLERQDTKEDNFETFENFYKENSLIFNIIKYNSDLFSKVVTTNETFKGESQCEHLVSLISYFTAQTDATKEEAAKLAQERSNLIDFCRQLKFNKLGMEDVTYTLVYVYQDSLSVLSEMQKANDKNYKKKWNQLKIETDYVILLLYKYYIQEIFAVYKQIFDEKINVFIVINLIFYFAIILIDLLLIFFLLYQQIIKRYVVKIKMINTLINSLSIK